MTKKESQNGSTMGINHYTINEKVSKTRIAENTNGWWYIRGGKVDFDFSGTILWENNKYIVKNGAVQD